MPALTEIHCRNAKPREKPYKLFDELGLFPLVTPAATARKGRLWRFRYRYGDVEKLKQQNGVFLRNLLDDLRLALEKLLQGIFSNSRSLENQLAVLGPFLKRKGGSPELTNMFQKLIEYYAKYQNTYVKHDDAVIEEEIELLFEITASFMKHLVRLNA
jgi:hypothetical protein